MQIAVISLFPEVIEAYLSFSLLSKARERQIFSVDVHDPLMPLLFSGWRLDGVLGSTGNSRSLSRHSVMP